MSQTDAEQAQSIAILEKAEGPVAVSVRIPHVLTRFVHGSFANRGEKKSWGPDRYSLPNRHRWLHVLMKPDCRPSMRFTFLWILVRISCPWLRFTRSLSLILSLLLLSLFPSFPRSARRATPCSLFLLILHRIVHLATCSTTCSLVLAAGNRQCTVKSSTHTHTHTHIQSPLYRRLNW